MNKTININLGGFAFQIEEDAYTLLHSYLQKIEANLGTSSETKEILDDIEFRIAELFRSDVKTNGGVITLESVQEIIKLVGEPEDFIADDAQEAGAATGTTMNTEINEPARKSLFRDIDRKVFSGVCSGLALYLNIDPVIIRILFLVAFYFWHPVLIFYIILWIAMPKPRTPAQWLEMKGGAEYFKTGAGKSYSAGSTAGYNKNNYYRRDVMSSVVHNSGDVLSTVIGLVLAVVSFMSLISLMSVFIFANSSLGEILPEARFLYELPHRLLSSADITLATFAVVLVAGVPLLLIFYLGLKLIFRFPGRGLLIVILSFILWFVGLGLIMYTGIDVAKSMKKKSYVTIEKELQPISSDTLYIKTIRNSGADRYGSFLMDMDKIDLYTSDEGQLIIEGEPDIVIKRGDKFKIIVKKKARGYSRADAEKNATYTEYFFQQKDSVLMLDKYFTLGDQAMIRRQEVTVTIQLPDSINYRVSPDLRYLIISEDTDYFEEDQDDNFSAELLSFDDQSYALKNSYQF